MSVEYRQLRPDEAGAAVDLWTDVFGSQRDQVQSEFTDNPRRIEQTHVAVASDGGLLSAIHYCHRNVRDVDGIPKQVGVIGHVGTRADARKQGHASRLLALTIGGMRRDGSLWSLLWGLEEARPLYQHHGWRPQPMLFRQGTLTGDRPSMLAPYTVRRYDPLVEPEDWAPLSTVYDIYNAARPLSFVRTLAYWRGFVALLWHWSWRTPPPVVLVALPATEAPQVVGYVIARFWEDGFDIREIGAREAPETVLPMLLAAIVDEAVRRNIAQGRVHLPVEPPIDAALQTMFGPTLHEVPFGGRMARAIAPDVDERHIDAMFAAPGAMTWSIDAY